MTTNGRWSLCCALLAIAACGEEPTPPPSLPVPASISITATDTVLSTVESTIYTAEVLDALGDPTGIEPVWSVSNPALATIDESGELSTTGNGSLYVIATAGDVRDSVSLRITMSYDDITVGETGSCAHTFTNDLWCWGSPRGNDTSGIVLNPTKVKGGHAFYGASMGVGVGCSVVTGFTAYCWGDPTDGHLGTGGGHDGILPAQVTGGFEYSSVSVGREHACSITVALQAVCWGKNAWGEIGDSTTPGGSRSPVLVAGGHEFTVIRAGGYTTCALTVGSGNGGKAWCWGANGDGVLGIDSALGNFVTRPYPVVNSGAYQQLTVGGNHQCGLTMAGAGECWGKNDQGQLGTGGSALEIRSSPEPVAGGHTFINISAGLEHTCAVDTDFKAWCWGSRSLGNAVAQSDVPVLVSGNHQFSRVSAGTNQTCGITAGGAAYCWGMGNMGDGVARPAGTNVIIPVRVRDP
jgi:alpha-tubulin suppressor-like RCC1 family protein